jgi:hypothetical protein
LGIKIPFQITIPLDIQPTLSDHTYYISHQIYVEIPWIISNKSLYIIIKDHHFFTLQNKLLKIPAKYVREFYSDSNLSNSKITIGIELPKNSFTFYEPIPFQLIVSDEGYKSEIESIKISIIRIIYFNNKDNHKQHFSTFCEVVLITQVLNPSGDLRNYKFEDNIQIPNREIKTYVQKKYIKKLIIPRL